MSWQEQWAGTKGQEAIILNAKRHAANNMPTAQTYVPPLLNCVLLYFTCFWCFVFSIVKKTKQISICIKAHHVEIHVATTNRHQPCTHFNVSGEDSSRFFYIVKKMLGWNLKVWICFPPLFSNDLKKILAFSCVYNPNLFHRCFLLCYIFHLRRAAGATLWGDKCQSEKHKSNKTQLL